MSPSPADPVRVLIVDDQRMFADALGALLDLDSRLEVVGVADDAAGAVDLAATADVALVDVGMPEVDGLQLTRLLQERRPALRVVLLSGRSESDFRGSLEAAGAAAFLRKGSLGAEVAEVVLRVAQE